MLESKRQEQKRILVKFANLNLESRVTKIAKMKSFAELPVEIQEKLKAHPITVAWSEEDKCFLARTPAYPFVGAHGDTPEETLGEILDAMWGVLEIDENKITSCKSPADEPLKVELTDGRIVISVGVKLLAWAQEDNIHPAKVIDTTQFAKDVIEAMDETDDAGASLLNKMIDKSVKKAIDDGALGVEYPKAKKK